MRRIDWICIQTLVLATLCCGSGVLVPSAVRAQTGTLAEPFPKPATNAALHYQRAMLHLAKVDDSDLEPLASPVWETAPDPSAGLSREVQRLLAVTRFAIHASAQGSRTAECNFGIDFSNAGAAVQLPHVDGMVQLGRLLTLRGAQAEANGQWEEALIIYFDGLRMGRHLTHQQTFLETLAGIDILRNNYYALASWATRCPARLLVARAFGLLESMQAGLVNPSQTIAREASILTLEFDELRDSYPDGDWTRLILDSLGRPVSGDEAKDRENAIAICVERGVPREIFDSPGAFANYLTELEATANRFIESVAACMTLPPKARVVRAAALNKKYAVVIPILSADTLIDPLEIGCLVAQHEADLKLARVALAVAATKKGQQYPPSLDEVAKRFGTSSVADPYSGKALNYQTQNDHKDFSLEVPSLGPLPRTSFSSRSPQPAE